MITLPRISSFYRYFIKTRGLRVKDAIRLQLTPIIYITHKIRGGTIDFQGYHIPGQRLLIIKTWDEFVFLIRPKTSDLDYATLIPEYYEYNNWFVPHIKESEFFVDVGANIGGYTIRGCRHAKLVIAIEPVLTNFLILQKNVELNNCDNVYALRMAVGKDKGYAVLRIPRISNYLFAGSASIIKRFDAEYHQELVKVDSLDNIVSCLSLNRIDFLKIDIEGAEGVAFRGMLETLKRTRYLMIEISECNEWLIRQIMKLGFKMLDKRGKNYFFVNKSIA